MLQVSQLEESRAKVKLRGLSLGQTQNRAKVKLGVESRSDSEQSHGQTQGVESQVPHLLAEQAQGLALRVVTVCRLPHLCTALGRIQSP